ncbi:MAG: substrate-binding domain-containing protein [Verrucomicrobia bacterium]|nr:substrate-binding domain-containing protein [Verrucomicrobiota bacterium]MBU4247564.1 substrate-binding domain-containing protein [Verrucomicrobiota bacterium]MBU4290716.1 substrate-binding domain-containing protein [Verrucomicrobiota bacterium]MBU4497625.1 substrate-binding domain-containing protein [Verrucomicrobiota bacterium]MCG2679728.1 substrate-binding domain-containing protein [Kiritimatiellia bacterium]
MRKTIPMLMSILLIIGFAGCGGKREAKPAPSRTTIAVIPKGTTHEFWKSVHAGANQAAKELDVDIIWKGALKEDNREAQIAVVEDFISRRVSGIVMAPLDDTALRAPVASAVRNGIPVVIFDSDLKSDLIVSFVATDNYLGGKLAGKRLAELLDGKGKVAMLRYQEGSASTMRREQGFLDAIKDYPGIEIVRANQYGGPTTETAYQASENMLAPLKNPKGGLTIQGVFAPNESTTFGMLRALQDESLAGKVRFVGFDSSVKLVEALRLGHIDGLVLQNPIRMGYLGVKTMVEHLRGQTVEKRIDTGATLATKENMDQPEIKELLEPKL